MTTSAILLHIPLISAFLSCSFLLLVSYLRRRCRKEYDYTQLSFIHSFRLPWRSKLREKERERESGTEVQIQKIFFANMLPDQLSAISALWFIYTSFSIPWIFFLFLLFYLLKVIAACARSLGSCWHINQDKREVFNSTQLFKSHRNLRTVIKRSQLRSNAAIIHQLGDSFN